jgi:hypothetical protein
MILSGWNYRLAARAILTRNNHKRKIFQPTKEKLDKDQKPA